MRLRPPGRAPAGAVLLVLLSAALLLTGLWWQGRDDVGLGRADLPVLLWFVEHRTPLLSVVAGAVTRLGGYTAVVLVSLATFTVLGRRGAGGGLRAAVLLAPVVGWLVSSVTKAAAGSARPPSADQLGLALVGRSFPSGHSTLAGIAFGMLALALLRSLRPGPARTTAVVLALLVPLAVGTTRLYLGHHWLTDVLGGWVLAATVVRLAARATRSAGAAPGGAGRCDRGDSSS